MGADNAIQLYRPLTQYEQACRIDFAELNSKLDRQLASSLDVLIKDVNDIQQNVVNQVRRWKVLAPGGYSRISKVTVNSTPFRQHFLNSIVYHYFEGREDAKGEISNSLGKRLRLRYVTEMDLLPKEAMDRFQKRAAVTKAEFSRMAAKERARAFTVAGVLEQDMLAATRQGLIKAIDEGWSLNEFSRYLKEANVKYTGTVYGTDKKKGEPLTPYHLENVLRTNYATVYNEGRLDMMNHPDVIEFVPAFQYSAILDSRVRPEHRDMDGRIYPRDDPIWMIWWPPNGYQCRCIVVAVTSNKEFSVSSPAPPTLVPDTGFVGAPEVKRAPRPAPSVKALELVNKEDVARLDEMLADLPKDRYKEATRYDPDSNIGVQARVEISNLKTKFLKASGIKDSDISDIQQMTAGWCTSLHERGSYQLQILRNYIDGVEPLLNVKGDIFERYPELRGWKPTPEFIRAGALWQRFNQRALSRAVGHRMTVYRGIYGELADEIRDAAKLAQTLQVELPVRPLSSFTAGQEVAMEFIQDPMTMKRGLVLGRKIDPLTEVWDSWVTNTKLLDYEREVIASSSAPIRVSIMERLSE
jgi:SPP1 gp7 family putative phage head morphogenesis protein